MKNNMDYFKTMNEKDLDLTKTAVDWTDKAFKGNGDCAAIARTTGKTCKVVLRDGEDTSFLEGIHEWQQASENDVNRELINSCVAQITPVTNEEFRWVLDFQLSELQGRNTAAYTMDGFIEMARFSISFEEAKAFKASRNQGIRKNEWHDLTVVVGIRSKIQR